MRDKKELFDAIALWYETNDRKMTHKDMNDLMSDKEIQFLISMEVAEVDNALTDAMRRLKE